MIPFTPKEISFLTCPTRSGKFLPREFLNKAILFTLTLNFVIQLYPLGEKIYRNFLKYLWLFCMKPMTCAHNQFYPRVRKKLEGLLLVVAPNVVRKSPFYEQNWLLKNARSRWLFSQVSIVFLIDCKFSRHRKPAPSLLVKFVNMNFLVT